ncbi:MAG: hypothetical protein ACLGI9_21470 [Thermoanaerobaculia bacterium]
MASPAHCFYHPERSALAICVSCRKPICQSCSTLWEGMHHCTACLARRRAAVEQRGTAARAVFVVLLTLALLAGVALLRAWIGAVLVEGF